MATACPLPIISFPSSTGDAYHSLFHHAVEGIFQTLPGGYFLKANPALARIYGYDSPDDLMNNVTDIAEQLYIDPARRAEFMRTMRETGSVRDFESEIRCKDGSIKWVSENARAVYYGKDLVYYEGFVADITERKTAEECRAFLEEELGRSRGETSPGGFPSETADEVENLLGLIQGFTELAQQEIAEGHSPDSCLEHIREVIREAHAALDRSRHAGG